MDRNISAALFSAFDFQRFEENGPLAALIRETERRYEARALSDDALAFVSAAGEAELPRPANADREDESL